MLLKLWQLITASKTSCNPAYDRGAYETHSHTLREFARITPCGVRSPLTVVCGSRVWGCCGGLGGVWVEDTPRSMWRWTGERTGCRVGNWRWKLVGLGCSGLVAVSRWTAPQAPATSPGAAHCAGSRTPWLRHSGPPSSKSSSANSFPETSTEKGCATPTGRPTVGFPFVIEWYHSICLLSFTFSNGEFLSFVPFLSTFIPVTRRLEELHLFTCQVEASKSKVFFWKYVLRLFAFVINNRFFLTFGCFICLVCRDTV